MTIGQCRFRSMGRPLATVARACLASFLLAGMSAAAAGQGKAVDLELVLAVDVSASVSPAELALQRGGLADAFRDPAVHAAIETAGGKVEFTVEMAVTSAAPHDRRA